MAFKTLLSFVLNGQSSLIVLGLTSLTIWILYELASILCFNRFMRSIGYPLAAGSRLPRPKTWLTRVKTSRSIGAIWFIQRTRWLPILISVVIIALSLFIAIGTGHALEFSRAGSLVVIAGLMYVLIAFYEERKMRESWQQAIAVALDPNDAKIIQKNMVATIARAQVCNQKLSFVVSVVGTLIGAYGDEILACSVFPLLHITDKSGIVCIQLPPPNVLSEIYFYTDSTTRTSMGR
jgi:hypothetical protein